MRPSHALESHRRAPAHVCRLRDGRHRRVESQRGYNGWSLGKCLYVPRQARRAALDEYLQYLIADRDLRRAGVLLSFLEMGAILSRTTGMSEADE